MFAILRINKIKSKQHLNAAVRHNLRVDYVDNADPSKKNLNKVMLGQNYSQIAGKLEDIFISNNIKPRKDAVIAAEVVLTASPEFFKNQPKENFTEWLKENAEFMVREFGLHNILQVVIHMDESTPHLHVIFTPVTLDKRLSMKDLYGGKLKLQALQTRYAEAMRKFGLTKGVEKIKKAKHTTVKEYYEAINILKKLPDNKKNKIFELINSPDDKEENRKFIENRLSVLKSVILDDDIKNFNKNRSKKKLKLKFK